MASILNQAVNAGKSDFDEEVIKQIRKRESLSDDITHKIRLCLDKTLFAPSNRNDIHALAACIDSVGIGINEASSRMYRYNIDCFSAEMCVIAGIILEATGEIEKAIALLRKRNNKELTDLCHAIKHYEKQSDLVYYSGVARLFSNEKNPVLLLKQREILQSLESAVNQCKKNSRYFK